jgi:hypothetical protein
LYSAATHRPGLSPANRYIYTHITKLGRQELVFVDADASVAMERGKARDATLLGGEESALSLYRERCAGAFEIYESISQPKLNAHIVIENGKFSSATVHVQKPVK